MNKLIIALILVAAVVGGYRFIKNRRTPTEQKSVEIMEITPAPTQAAQRFGEIIETSERENKDLPSAGASTEVKEKPSEKELQKMIKEFDSDF